jgi:amino acid permease
MENPTVDETGQPIDPETAIDPGVGSAENTEQADGASSDINAPLKENDQEDQIANFDNASDSDGNVPVSPEGLPESPEGTEENERKPERVRRFATLMNLINSVLGAGILGVPASMHNCGVVIASILLIIVAVMTQFGAVLTIKLQYRTKANGFDELAQLVLGKWGSIALSISTVLFCYSCMIAYLVIARDYIVSWFDAAGVDFSSKFAQAMVVLINSLAVPIPLLIPRSITFLSYFSFATVVSIFFFFVSIIVKASIALPNGLGPGVRFFKGGMGLFSSISIYALAFCLPAVILPILNPYNPDVRKRSKVTLVAMIICTIVTLVPGVLGYLSLGENTKNNVLNSYPSNDVLMILVKIAFYLVVSFSYPCVGQSVLSSWSQLIFKVNNHAELPNKKRAVVLLVGNIIALAIAMVLPNIRPALSVGGSVGGALDSFVFPPLIWVVLSKRPKTAPRNVLMILYTIFGITITCICIYQSVVDAIDEFTK